MEGVNVKNKEKNRLISVAPFRFIVYFKKMYLKCL